MVRIIWVAVIGFTLAPASSARSEEFNWENMLHVWMKFNKDFEYTNRNIESYMKAIRPQTWEQVRNNEFQLNDQRKEIEKLMKERVAAVKAEVPMTLNVKLNIGKYDFDAKGFPIENLTETHYWYQSARNYADSLPYQFNLYFKNTQGHNFLAMDPKAAEALLADRKNRYGDIDRQFQSTINCRIVKRKGGESLLAEIDDIKVYSDNGKTKLVGQLGAAPSSKK